MQPIVSNVAMKFVAAVFFFAANVVALAIEEKPWNPEPAKPPPDMSIEEILAKTGGPDPLKITPPRPGTTAPSHRTVFFPPAPPVYGAALAEPQVSIVPHRSGRHRKNRPTIWEITSTSTSIQR